MYLIIILITMIILNIIYHVGGFLGVLAILVSAINLFMTTMILIRDPQNFWIKIAQMLSIFYIVLSIMLDISTFRHDITKLAFILPLSINKITFF